MTIHDRIKAKILAQEIDNMGWRQLPVALGTEYLEGKNMPDVLEELEHSLIVAALNETHGSVTEAAKVLGINRTTLWMKIKRLV